MATDPHSSQQRGQGGAAHHHHHQETWTPSSWRSRPIKQSPQYPDAEKLSRAVAELSRMPPLVHPSEILTLKAQLRDVAHGKAFLLQGGDCAELFDYCEQGAIESKIKLLLQMSVVLIWGTNKPVVRIGRMAGQYAKPRSSPTEMVQGKEIPSFRGDILNGYRVDERDIDPSPGVGFGGGSNSSSGSSSPAQRARHYGESRPEANKREYYDTSAHFVWIGDRTRQLDHAHVEFFRGIANPIGIKVGPTTPSADLLTLLRTLNPSREPGKITLITRYGAGRVAELLPQHIRAVEDSEYTRCVVWQCDPMHGNTLSTPTGIKTRRFNDIYRELQESLRIHKEQGSYLGGVHLELTGDAVTECLGGSEGLAEDDLSTNYTSFCDPRLNEKQALELAFLIADHYSQEQKLSSA
ncbi:DAHP synthetase, class II [Ophiocordyceps sinensis CO18]|uniref:Phospho-2-dehydro-3-deoxyheptonate aldolase n=1 Tax=Ophiocordyceps sinensis (strain Co18 / CGMCC 3.14243) TaxID=911162 RepID=T4ZZH6_OPHSC|nr:DAHP synthetase, class II [Ophiocordyceps sinensis CO18]